MTGFVEGLICQCIAIVITTKLIRPEKVEPEISLKLHRNGANSMKRLPKSV